MTTRQCDECKYSYHREWDTRLHCHKGHNPRFYQPKSPTDQYWGYKRDCNDFIPIIPDTAQITVTIEIEGRALEFTFPANYYRGSVIEQAVQHLEAYLHAT